MYEKQIEIIAELMRKRLEEKQKKYGELWEVNTITNLQKRVGVKMQNYKDCMNSDKEMISLVDLANQAMLLCLRLMGDKPYDTSTN